MTRYPLAWPPGWKRTPGIMRKSAQFHGSERVYSTQPNGGSWMRKRDLTMAESTSRALGALRRFGVLEGDAIISTNVVLRLDGLPRSGQPAPDDPGVAVYWQRPDDRQMKCMAVDRYDRVADNLAAIAATLEAMRAIERHGGALILDRAFQGFDALPAPGQTVARGWREILEIAPEVPVTEAMITERYRKLASLHHPDKGGDTARFQELGAARTQALQSIGAT